MLIHAATGGVGLAAIQVARRLGARIFATAGSPEKREFLRLLGIEHVYDSRSLDFAEQILEATSGEGVDIVLNSLAGEAIAKGLAALRPYGRFLELGKRDIYQNSRLGMGRWQQSDLLGDRPRPDDAGAAGCGGEPVLEEVMALLESRSLCPLPFHVFPASEIRGAFREIAQARHMGKLVVLMGELDRPPVPVPSDAPLAFFRRSIYLITGGLGGFGLAVAEWMAERGARHFGIGQP